MLALMSHPGKHPCSGMASTSPQDCCRICGGTCDLDRNMMRHCAPRTSGLLLSVQEHGCFCLRLRQPKHGWPISSGPAHACRDEASTSTTSDSAALRPAEDADLIDAIAEGRPHVPPSTRPVTAPQSSQLPQRPAQQTAPTQQTSPGQQSAASQAPAQWDAQKPNVELHMSTAASILLLEGAAYG